MYLYSKQDMAGILEVDQNTVPKYSHIQVNRVYDVSMNMSEMGNLIRFKISIKFYHTAVVRP